MNPTHNRIAGDSRRLHAASVVIALAAALAPSAARSQAPLATRYWGSYENHTPAIVVGDPNGAPPDLPANHVDPNTPGSPFAGVVSISLTLPGTGSFLCSGAAISDRHILTAAHCLDEFGGVTPGGGSTGDGQIDFALNNIVVVFNEDNPNSNQPGASLRGVSDATIHPDWNGFLNVNAPPTENSPSLTDDIAVLELSSPIPAGVPIYPLSTDPFQFVTPLVMAGYGNTGDGVNGETALSGGFFVKRTGENAASQFLLDDEAPGTAREGFQWDFDNPTDNTGGVDGLLGLGNDLETTVGGGDSGGPSFIWNDTGGGLIDADELTLFGVNSFNSSNGVFGSIGGGMVVSSYLGFINGAIGVPEPGSLLLALLGVAFATLRRR